MNVHIYSLKGLRKQNEDTHVAILNEDGKNKISPQAYFELLKN